jgi:hypothetical protein
LRYPHESLHLLTGPGGNLSFCFEQERKIIATPFFKALFADIAFFNVVQANFYEPH